MIKKICTVAAAIALALVHNTAHAQRRLLAPRPQLQEEIVAVGGQPFGVGRMVVQLPRGTAPSRVAGNEYTLAEKNGRALYPAYASGKPVRGLLREVLDRPQMTTVYFLFPVDDPKQAAAPLDLTLYGPTAVNRQVTPTDDPSLHARLLSEWWQEYSSAAARSARNNEYPQLVDAYLMSMLSRRLQLAAPEVSEPALFSDPKSNDLVSAASLLSGGEAQRVQMVRRVARGADRGARADQPPPAPVRMSPLEIPAAPADLKVESIASHVPAECLYVRFGSFTNYQWFRVRMEEWGGDLRRLVAARGLNSDLSARIERQLSLHETQLSALLGPAVISDVAMIGDDTFFKEGAAIGMLFQARNSFALNSDISRQRLQAQTSVKGATDQKVKIAGHDVSLLSTPDNRVRSFYAIDGDFHLVTTSRAMVERFYAAGAGQRALAATPDFRHARLVLPLDRDDSVFVFLSNDFFAQLASPQYQIELARRLRSAAEMDVLEMARLTTRLEGKSGDSIAALISGDILPRGFGQRPDGSRLTITDDGQLIDSQRGGEGSYLPIPDAPLERVTAEELADYSRFAGAFESQLGRLDPIALAIKRLGSEGNRERVEIAARMLPLAEKHYSLARKFLGPPDKQRVAPSEADVISAEGIMANSMLSMFTGGGTQHEPYHLIVGMRDVNAPAPQRQGGPLMSALSMMQSTPFYLGAWPNPGFLQIFGVGRGDAPVDAEGFSRGVLFWQRQVGSFFLVSPQRETLADVGARLKVVETPRPAQFWLHAGDLSQSKMAQFANGMGYNRAKQVTEGNTHFLHSLTTQLGVPAADALAAAEKLLDARIVSPIGGQFELVRREGEFPMWVSTADTGGPSNGGGPLRGLLTGQGGQAAPAGYLAPPLDWLRGLDMDLGVEEGKLAIDAQVLMERRVSDGRPMANNSGPATPTASQPNPPPTRQPPPRPPEELPLPGPTPAK